MSEKRIELTAAEKIRLDQVAQARELLRFLGFVELPNGSFAAPDSQALADPCGLQENWLLLELINHDDPTFEQLLAAIRRKRIEFRETCIKEFLAGMDTPGCESCEG